MDSEMKTLQDIDLRELASIYDADSDDSFVTVFINLIDKNWKKFIEKRMRNCIKALHGRADLRENVNKTFDVMMGQLEKLPHLDQERGLALVGSKKNDFYRIYQLSVPPENLFIVDSSPYIKPLALLQDEWEQFLLVFIDGTSAQIYLMGARQIEESKEVETDVMGRHKKGGWSQMRFNRLRKEAVDKFYKMVARDVNEVVAEEGSIVSIILAGPGKGKKEILEYLTPDQKEMVSRVLDIDKNIPLAQMIKEITDIVHLDEKIAGGRSVDLLQKLILTGGPAVYGLDNVVDASRNGIVRELFILKGHPIGGWICENCQAVQMGMKKTCPYCNGPTSRVDVVEEIREFVVRSGGELEFIDESPYLESLGGVAAILRYSAE
jgi:peptide chain release factor subunit 1